MLDLFRDVVSGKNKDYRIKDTFKLEEVAKELDIETEGRDVEDIAMDLYDELERTYTQVEGEIPLAKRVCERFSVGDAVSVLKEGDCQLPVRERTGQPEIQGGTRFASLSQRRRALHRVQTLRSNLSRTGNHD